MAGNLDDADYLAQDAEIKALIAKAEKEAPPPDRDVEPLREILDTDFESLYKTFTQEEKRRFWRGIIKEIHMDGKDITGVTFL